MKTRRPNLLQFNDWVAECVDQLERSPHRTDQRLAVWFELQRITDEAMSSFGLDDTSASSPLTESRVQAVLRWFDKRMESWKNNTPNSMLTGIPPSTHQQNQTKPTSQPTNPLPVPMILEYRSAVLTMYELGVGEGYRDPEAIKRRYFTLPTLDEDGRKQEPPMSVIRIDINVKWMNAAHELLDALLTCSAETMRRFPNLMYTRFTMAVTSLLKIHFSVRTGALGEVVTPESVNVSYYLDAMANKLGEASGGGKYKIPARWYHVVAVKGRDWYERLEKRYGAGSGSGSGSGEGMGPGTGTGGVTSSPSSTEPMTSVPTASGSHVDMSFSVPPMGPGMENMRDGYVAMSGAGMWPMDGGHQNQFFQSMAGYPQASLPPQFAYEQRPGGMPGAGGASGQVPGTGTGMELDGWLPDGSIFGLPPLPDF